MSIRDEVPQNAALKKKNLQEVIYGTTSIDNFLKGMINLNDSGVFCEPTCAICQSKYRENAEKEWLSTYNAEQVCSFFTDKGEKYTIPVIKNHMEAHLDQSQSEIRKKEYVDKISHLTRDNVTTLDRLELTMTSIDERMVSINSLEDPSKSMAEVEVLKSNIACKLADAMGKLLQLRAKMLGEMKDEGAVFTINKDKFSNLFRDMLENASEEERLIINKVFMGISQIAKEY